MSAVERPGTTADPGGDPAPERGPLRVLIVSSFGVVGGAESYLLRILDAGPGLAVRSLLLGPGPLEGELARRGVPVEVWPTGPRGSDVGRAALRLAPALRRSSADVVWANGVKAASVAVPAGLLAGVPVVWVKHDLSFDARLGPVLGRLAAGVVAVSTDAAAATGRTDAEIVPPPRTDRTAAPAEARRFWERRGLGEFDGPTVAAATRLLPYKGVDDAIRALAEPGGRAWRLVVIGDDDYAAPGEGERLRALAIRLGVADRVVMAGPVEEAGRWLAAFDAVAVLTRDDGGFGGEGFSLAGLEGMLAGLPVVATGPSWLRNAGARGAAVVVPPGSPQSVAAALEGLADPGTRRRIGRAGRLLARAHPVAATTAARVATALRAAAARPGVPGSGPPVSVVTTVRNEATAVDALIGRLVPQLLENDELVVVDGGSTDDTAVRVEAWAARDPRVRLVDAPGTNIPAGRNRGIAAARHDVVACTDAGCEPAAGWLDALRAAFAADPAPDLVTGVYRAAADGPWQDAMAVANFPLPEEARRRGPLVRAYGALLGRNFDPAMPTGRSVAFTRGAWEAVGGFPEHLDTGEDVTFGRTIAASGRRCVLAADAEVVWAPRPDLRSTARMYERYGFGGARSGDRKLVVRDLARAAAYVAGPVVFVGGGRWARRAVAAAGAAYLSLPVARAMRRPRPVLVAALVPFALAVKDASKAVGCLRGLRASGRP
jgi:glycosyltransferase involved in cell wall biosynthesis/GT2 family glycosyltransferase